VHPGNLTFGIYPGGAAGGDSGLLTGPADDPSKIDACLDQLQGSSLPFVVRCYDSFQDPDSPFGKTACAPHNYSQYAREGSRPLDLVLQFRSASGNVTGYLEFVRAKIREHHASLYSLQIAEEPNFTDGPNVIDGPYPRILEAVVSGVIVAKQTLRELNATHVKVGLNSTPTFGPSANFWPNLAATAEAGAAQPKNFVESLDYVGLDFFPDVFRPAAPDGRPGDIASSTIAVLETMRNVWLPSAGIPPTAAIHITEHGWPTGPERSAARQAEVLEKVIRTVAAQTTRLNIHRYTLFSLRDVAAETPENLTNLFTFLGITTASYSPKPAFATLQKLISELSNAT
jgi:hypothetical protein